MLHYPTKSFGVTIGFAILSVLGVTGCDNGPPRGAIRGSVTVAGQPLAGGRILFIPQLPLEAVTVTSVVKEGTYELKVHEGPIVGAYRVEVEADPPLGFALDDEEAFAARGQVMPPNPIPPPFNRQSTLTTEIKPGDNTYDVVVPSIP